MTISFFIHRRCASFPKRKHSLSRSAFFLEASPRLELGMRILQTLALPLGYDAVYYIIWSGRRDSDPRLSPWQGDTLPLSHSRKIDCLNNISNVLRFCNKFLKSLFFSFQKHVGNLFQHFGILQLVCTFFGFEGFCFEHNFCPFLAY